MFFGIFFLSHMPVLRDLIAGLKVRPVLIPTILKVE